MTVSCTDDEFQLKNKWQLREYCTDGTVTKVDSIFYGFQKGSFMAICIDENAANRVFYGNYFLKDGELSIKLLDDYIHNNRYYDKFFGWSAGERTFQIEEISSSRMRLNYEGTVSIFRKY
jgi:hypothetical protein